MYVMVRQYQDASNELAPYVERRPYDPEGLFYYGQALEGLGKTAEARQMYERAIEAARTAPRYRQAVHSQVEPGGTETDPEAGREGELTQFNFILLVTAAQ